MTRIRVGIQEEVRSTYLGIYSGREMLQSSKLTKILSPKFHKSGEGKTPGMNKCLRGKELKRTEKNEDRLDIVTFSLY